MTGGHVMSAALAGDFSTVKINFLSVGLLSLSFLSLVSPLPQPVTLNLDRSLFG